MIPPDVASPRVTAILACHNRKAKTLACLASLVDQDRPLALRVVLFDDGSSDGTAEAVRHHHPGVEILRGDGAAFWSGGMHRALAAALDRRGDYLLWLNDDVVLHPDALRRLVDTARTCAAAGHPMCLVGGAVADPLTGTTSYAGVARRPGRPLGFRRVAPEPAAARRCDTLVGNVVLLPWQTAVRIGNIDPAFRHTLGDLDYGLRVATAGGWVGLAPGHVGTCQREVASGRWFDGALPLTRRWTLLHHPLGFPLRPWLHFARRHGEPFWFLWAPLPYWRLFAPVWLARRLDARRTPETGEARHA